MNNKLVIIRGLPGSGKSTFAKKMFPCSLHLETDMFHIHNGIYEFNREKRTQSEMWLFDIVRFSLENGMDVILSCVFGHTNKIRKFADLCERLGVGFMVYRMMNDYGNIHNVPEEVLNDMKNTFQDWNGEVKVYSGNDL